MAKGYKTGGRKAGTPNKRRSILDVCESIGLDPFLEMAKIAQQPDEPRRMDALKELCQYIEPKKKAVEHSGGLDVRLQKELESLMKLSEEELLALLPKK